MSAPGNTPHRLVTRIMLDFMMQAIPALVRWHEGNPVRGVIFLAIAQANRPRFAEFVRLGTDAMMPENSQKPVSIGSLAQSLDLPKETVRRHVSRLVTLGLCARQHNLGFVVTEAATQSPQFAEFAAATSLGFLRMLRDLRAVGLDVAGGSTGGRLTATDPAVQHVIFDFLLRLVESGAPPHDGDMLRAYVFSAIMWANARPYTHDREGAWKYATLAQSPPDDLRLPVTNLEVSAITGVPRETVRRHVLAMVADRDLIRVRGRGVINPTVTPRDGRLHEAGAAVTSRFMQVLGDLRRLGFDYGALDGVD